MMGAISKDSVLGASLMLSVVSLVLLFGLTCAADPVQHAKQEEYDKELVLKLQVQKITKYCNLVLFYES